MVELFFNKELADVAFEVEALDEWKSIAEELGFEAQLSLTKGKESPIPYPFLNEVMDRVYTTLCPCKVEFKTYNKSTIPLEIMKQITFSVRDKHFNKIEIWYDDKTPDPLVVGYMNEYYAYTKSGYNRLADENGKSLIFPTHELATAELERQEITETYNVSHNELGKYLIGRWGDELLDFPSLKKRAIDAFIESEGGELKKEVATKSEKLKLLSENVHSYFNGNMPKHEVLGNRW